MKQVGNLELLPQAAVQRITSQRRLLWELIIEAGGHLDADELYRRAREREPKISLSTVYRNLQLFKKLGLIEEMHLAEDHHHYEAKGPLEHYHLVCLGCGRVIEFESPLIERITNMVREEKRFDVTSAEIDIEGYCSRCRGKRQ